MYGGGGEVGGGGGEGESAPRPDRVKCFKSIYSGLNVKFKCL